MAAVAWSRATSSATTTVMKAISSRQCSRCARTITSRSRAMDNQRFEGNRGGNDQQRFRDRDRHNNYNRHDRNDRGPIAGNDRGQDRGPDRGGEPRHFQPSPPQQTADAGVEAAGQQPSLDNQRRRREPRLPQPNHEQPEFLRRPVRRPRREGNGEPNGNGNRRQRWTRRRGPRLGPQRACPPTFSAPRPRVVVCAASH